MQQKLTENQPFELFEGAERLLQQLSCESETKRNDGIAWSCNWSHRKNEATRLESDQFSVVALPYSRNRFMCEAPFEYHSLIGVTLLIRSKADGRVAALNCLETLVYDEFQPEENFAKASQFRQTNFAQVAPNRFMLSLRNQSGEIGCQTEIDLNRSFEQYFYAGIRLNWQALKAGEFSDFIYPNLISQPELDTVLRSIDCTNGVPPTPEQIALLLETLQFSLPPNELASLHREVVECVSTTDSIIVSLAQFSHFVDSIVSLAKRIPTSGDQYVDLLSPMWWRRELSKSLTLARELFQNCSAEFTPAISPFTEEIAHLLEVLNEYVGTRPAEQSRLWVDRYVSAVQEMIMLAKGARVDEILNDPNLATPEQFAQTEKSRELIRQWSKRPIFEVCKSLQALEAANLLVRNKTMQYLENPEAQTRSELLRALDDCCRCSNVMEMRGVPTRSYTALNEAAQHALESSATESKESLETFARLGKLLNQEMEWIRWITPNTSISTLYQVEYFPRIFAFIGDFERLDEETCDGRIQIEIDRESIELSCRFPVAEDKQLSIVEKLIATRNKDIPISSGISIARFGIDGMYSISDHLPDSTIYDGMVAIGKSNEIDLARATVPQAGLAYNYTREMLEQFMQIEGATLLMACFNNEPAAYLLLFQDARYFPRHLSIGVEELRAAQKISSNQKVIGVEAFFRDPQLKQILKPFGENAGALLDSKLKSAVQSSYPGEDVVCVGHVRVKSQDVAENTTRPRLEKFGWHGTQIYFEETDPEGRVLKFERVIRYLSKE